MVPPSYPARILCWGILLCLFPGKLIRGGISEIRAIYVAAETIEDIANAPRLILRAVIREVRKPAAFSITEKVDAGPVQFDVE